MRHIKFRAWYNGGYQTNVTIDPDTGEAIRISEGYCETDEGHLPCIEINRYGIIIEQFTGLYDRNGREIYEGDICSRKVRCSNGYPEQRTMQGRTIPAEIETRVWEEKQTKAITMHPEVRFGTEFITKTPRSEEIGEREFVSSWDYEIIGNIHEKPAREAAT